MKLGVEAALPPGYKGASLLDALLLLEPNPTLEAVSEVLAVHTKFLLPIPHKQDLLQEVYHGKGTSDHSWDTVDAAEEFSDDGAIQEPRQIHRADQACQCEAPV